MFLTNLIKAQTTSDINQNRFQFLQKGWNVGVAYFGETLLRSGFSIAVDYSVINWQKIKDKKKGKKFRSLAVHLGARYWNYYQPKSHVGNAIDIELFIRRTRSFDYKNKIGVLDFGLSVGLGWNRLFGSVYKPLTLTTKYYD